MSKSNGVTVESAAPGWVGWLFFGIGVAFLSCVYVGGLRPHQKAGAWRLFERPDDIDLWTASAITIICFTGAGAAILAHRATWVKSRRWFRSLKQDSPNEPWRWRPTGPLE